MAFDPLLYRRKATYEAQKGGKIDYPNSYAYMAARALDGNHRVLSFQYNKVRFPVSNGPSLIYQHFDFDVKHDDGNRTLAVITTCDSRYKEREEAIIEAAEAHADSLGALFELWTELELFGLNPDYMRSIVHFIMDRKYLTELEPEF